jgi:hypothetical protein
MQAGVGISTCDVIEDGWFCYKKLTYVTYEQNKEIIAIETCIVVQNLFMMKFPEL